jgi:hypothetical protein
MHPPLHAQKVLPNTGLLILSAEGSQVSHIVVGIRGITGTEGQGERIEGLGLVGGLLVAMAQLDLGLTEGMEGRRRTGLLALIPDLPEVLGGKLLVVAPRLDHFGHQQWVIIIADNPFELYVADRTGGAG